MPTRWAPSSANSPARSRKWQASAVQPPLLATGYQNRATGPSCSSAPSRRTRAGLVGQLEVGDGVSGAQHGQLSLVVVVVVDFFGGHGTKPLVRRTYSS